MSNVGSTGLGFMMLLPLTGGTSVNGEFSLPRVTVWTRITPRGSGRLPPLTFPFGEFIMDDIFTRFCVGMVVVVSVGAAIVAVFGGT